MDLNLADEFMPPSARVGDQEAVRLGLMTTNRYRQRQGSVTPVQETEAALVNKLGRVLGHVPVGTIDLLHVLTHPDVIDLTEEYVRAKRMEDSKELNPEYHGPACGCDKCLGK